MFSSIFSIRSQGSIDSLFREKEKVEGIDEALISIQISKQIRNSDLELASYHNQKALEILEKSGNDSLLAVALIEMGVTYTFRAEFDKAFEVNHRGLELARKSKDSLSMIDALNNMAIDYYYLEDFEKSGTFFAQTVEIAEAIEDPKRMANGYNNLGLIYSELGLLEKEKEQYIKARKIFLASDDREGVAMTDLNLGSVLVLEGKYREARKALERSYAMYESLSHYTGLLDVQSSLITLEEELGNLDKAIRLAKEANDMAVKKKARNIRIHFLELLENLYSKGGDVKNAYEVLKLRKALEDSVLNENTNRTIAELETKYETAKKEQEITKLALENEKVNYELQAQQNQKYFFIAVIISLLLLAAFIGWRLNTSWVDLSGGGSLHLIYDSSIGAWLELSRSNNVEVANIF